MREFATVSSGDGSLGDGELSHSGVSQSGDTSDALAGVPLQVLNGQSTT